MNIHFSIPIGCTLFIEDKIIHSHAISGVHKAKLWVISNIDHASIMLMDKKY